MSSDNQKYIRNFAIVAHIDHGKSTLADRLLEETGTIDKRLMTEQILDSNPIERERGITIKLAPVRMKYRYENQEFILNLIDTPGHVDFSYEVSRSMSACEGIILVVDATQNIQAQTVAHMQLIKSNKLKVIPVINKIDLDSAKTEEVVQSLVKTFGFSPLDILKVSAKKGTNIDQLLRSIVLQIPPPCGKTDGDMRGLVFSSKFDIHKGVIIFVRIIDGIIDIEKFKQQSGNNLNNKLQFHATKASFYPLELGFFTPEMKSVGILNTGDVGYIATGMKELNLARIGDTLFQKEKYIIPLSGYKEPKPMVYLSLYPTDNDDFLLLRESLEKLHLTDSSFTFKPHSSLALGKGFLCGFLGLLHAEVIAERLEKEYTLNILATAPNVEYQVILKSGEDIIIRSSDDYPDPSKIETIKEPIMMVTIYSPSASVGAVMQLCQSKRGEFINMEYIGDDTKFSYIIPLSEMIIDFFDLLKSATSGYASLDYEYYEHRKVDAVKLDILLNGKPVDAFSQIIVRSNTYHIAENTVNKLKDLIPKHQFQIPVQAAIGGKIIARADIKAFRKDVTQKLYGGDQSRKDKLLDKQKKGKKKMRQVGKVEIPQEVFLKLYKQS